MIAALWTDLLVATVPVVVALAVVALGFSVRRREWRHERRHDAYANFLDALSRDQVAKVDIHDEMVDSQPSVWDNHYPALRHADADLQNALYRLELVASDEGLREARRLFMVAYRRSRRLYLHIEMESHAPDNRDAADETVEYHSVRRLVAAGRRDLRTPGKLGVYDELEPVPTDELSSNNDLPGERW